MPRRPRQTRTVALRRWAAAAALGIGLATALLPAAAPLAEDGGPAGTAAGSAAALPDEYAVKAAFLYNFAKFTRWPAEAFANAWEPLRVCVLGEDPFGTALETIAGKRIGTRRLAVRRVASADLIAGCHIVFLGGGAGLAPGAVPAGLGGRPVLTVSDRDGPAAGAASMIRLHTVAEKIRFHVDAATAQGAGLSFSSQLLSLSQPAGNAAAAVAQETPAG